MVKKLIFILLLWCVISAPGTLKPVQEINSNTEKKSWLTIALNALFFCCIQAASKKIEEYFKEDDAPMIPTWVGNLNILSHERSFTVIHLSQLKLIQINDHRYDYDFLMTGNPRHVLWDESLQGGMLFDIDNENNYISPLTTDDSIFNQQQTKN